jgi:hypothetical protein
MSKTGTELFQHGSHRIAGGDAEKKARYVAGFSF